MADKLHKNYQKASYLIIASLLLDPIEFLVSKYSGTTKDEILFEILGLAFIALTAYAVKRGVVWVKYILAIITLLGVVTIVMTLQAPFVNYPPLLITIMQVIAMTWALVLLFQIPTNTGQDPLDSEI